MTTNDKTGATRRSQDATGSARPSAATVRFVEQWLWSSEYRETRGQPWTGDYIRDTARMIEDAIAQSPNKEMGQ